MVAARSLNTSRSNPSRSTAEAARELLKASAPREFTRVLLKNFDSPVGEYIEKRFRYKPLVPMEPELRSALEVEFRRVGVTPAEATKLASHLERRRTLQTIAHTTLTNGPGFLGANWLASLGFAPGEVCIAATFSGVPFNNDSRPGCLNYGDGATAQDFVSVACPRFGIIKQAEAARAAKTSERRLSIVPGSLARTAVYRSDILEYTSEIIPYFSDFLQQNVNLNVLDGGFSAFALSFCASVDSRVLGRRIVYIDLCSIIATYLAHVLLNEAHPITRLCFEGQHLSQLELMIGRRALFSAAGSHATPFSQFYRDDEVISNGKIAIRWDRQTIVAQLESGSLCPGLLLVYTALAFSNGFQCLGGFNQVEYLKLFKGALQSLEPFKEHRLDSVPTDALALGRARDAHGRDLYPLDILRGTEVVWDRQVSFGEFATPTVLRGHWMRHPEVV